jgi:type VI secretion system protein
LSPPAGVDALDPLPVPLPFQPASIAQPQVVPTAPTPATPSGGDADALLEQIAPLLGLTRSDLKEDWLRTLATMASLLRTLISGLVVMVEARARAKAQLGAQTTILQFDGNNPIKFARTPEQALLQLLNAPERGYLAAEQAIEESFVDLQSHQMATLRAMQGALRATLDRFSPKAIRARVEDKGLLSQILPGKRDAALWRAYEKEFSGVNHGSDEAFMEVFAREFRKAYEEEVASKRC